MAISRYPGNQTTWTQELPIAPPGSLAAPLFDFYPSLGDTTIASATNLTTTQDGPSKVWRFGALTVNALLSFTKRARPQFILCDSLVMGAGGGMSMTGRGAAGASNWPIEDITIPQSVRLSAKYVSQRIVIDYIQQNGIWVGDPVFWKFPDPDVGDCRATVTPGSVVLLSAAGCGLGAAGIKSASYATGGGIGKAGTNGGTGGGAAGAVYGQGASYPAQSTGGGKGYPWGGGPASGPAGHNGFGYSFDSAPVGGNSSEVGQYCGKGGDAVYQVTAAGSAGNPGGVGRTDYGGSVENGGNGVGGGLVVICRGDIDIASGAVIQADGMPGGNAISIAGYVALGGSGSGGGHVSLIYGGSYTNNGTVRANGGAPGAVTGPGSAAYGSAGGVGSVVTKTFAQMGWT